MLSLMDAMTGPVIRSWHIRLPDPSRGRREEVHKATDCFEAFSAPASLMRGYPLSVRLTQHRFLTVDGIEVESPEDGSPHAKGSGILQVRVGNHDCCVGYRAASRPGRYYYSCVVDGVVVPELNETVGDGGDGDDDSVPRPGEVFVDSVSSAKDSFGAAFLEFRVVTRRGGGGGGGRRNSRARELNRGSLGSKGDGTVGGNVGGVGANIGDAVDDYSYAVVWRRFTAFRVLHFDIVNMLRGSHLLASLPPLPAKCINPLVNQMGSAFVERRRMTLQTYLRRLLEVPKARACVNLMGFLGLHPITGSPLPWAASTRSESRRPPPTDTPPRKDGESQA